MRPFRWPVVAFVLCVLAALLAVGVRPTWVGAVRHPAVPRPLPPGDQEMAWVHTTTAASTWERFVTGLKRVEAAVPGFHVDDAGAFLDQTTAVPEVVIGKDGHAGKLRVRWYKVTSDVSAGAWVAALAARDPAPLAVIGGGSSDRAVDLARDMARQPDWHGDKPLLLITTATADNVDLGPDAPVAPGGQSAKLIDVYHDRTFRFCFTNRQMSAAVIDFVFADPTLRPGPVVGPAERLAGLGAAGAWAAVGGLGEVAAPLAPTLFAVAWLDDPYSVDLSWQFRNTLYQKLVPTVDGLPEAAERDSPHFYEYTVPFSVGGYSKPNRYEAENADAVVPQLPPRGQRSLLVLPAAPAPARRFLRALCDATPRAARRLVAVTGDGIGMNVIYRDGEFAWPVRSLPVPLVMFTHNDPFAWDGPDAPVPAGYALRPPNSTEDALHFAELGRRVACAAFPPPDQVDGIATVDGVVSRADHLAARLRNHAPPFFDADGNRLGGTGEFVVVLRPQTATELAGGPDATVDVYRRGGPDGRWARVRSLPVFQTRRPVAPAE